MKAQSETYKIIAEGLSACGISRNCALCIIHLLETDEQTQAMLDWILELENIPTEQECLKEAVMITRELFSTDRGVLFTAAGQAQESKPKNRLNI